VEGRVGVSSGYEEIVVYNGSVTKELWAKLLPLGVYHNGPKGAQLTIWVHKNLKINQDPEDSLACHPGTDGAPCWRGWM
jgi:hypothetical protein